MTTPDAVCYPDRAWHGAVAIVEHERIARDTFRIRVACPEVAAKATPGQFVMLRISGADDPLLGRAFALYDVYKDADGKPAGIDVVYLILGRMTRRLSQMQVGQRIELWGPLGNGFRPRPLDRLVIAAGGIGQTPFMAVAREALGLATYGDSPRESLPAPEVILCYGVRSAEYLAGVSDFQAIGVDVRVSTDDGTAGVPGRVTDVLRPILMERDPTDRVHVLCCGPEPMMEAVAELAHELGVSCEVSLETPMACGLGICFSCVAKVRTPDGGWDYRRTCVEGPVFDATTIEF